MKRIAIAPLALLAVLAAGPVRSAAEEPPNPMHPLFAPLDAAGRPATRAEDVSADATCGACHDARFIASHTEHGERGEPGARATCIQCHAEGGRLEVSRLEGGKLRREDLRIGRPRAANCASCHGLVSDGSKPVLLPADFEAGPGGARTWSLTQGEGAVFAPQPMSDSFLDLEGKDGLHAPWDAHAAKLVGCVDCHHARNDPRHGDLKKAALRFLTSDPRRQGTAEFLHRPDHALAKPDCRSCHAPLSVHGFLPYRERHMQVLACEACHAPGAMAPAAEAIDATAVTPAGTPLFTWRNVDPRPGESLNTATVRPLRPLFVLRVEPDGERRLAPVNVVSRWRWVSGPERAEVAFATVVRAFREGEGYAPAVLAALDGDRDGRLSEVELRLDTPAKVEAVRARLRALGVADPAIDGVMESHPLAHGVAGRDRALRDCGACHGEGSCLSGDYALATYLPGGVPPRPPEEGGRVELSGTVVPAAGGGLALRREEGTLPGGLHVLGRSRQAATNALGLALFTFVFLGVATHGAIRLFLRLRRTARRRAEGQPDEAAPARQRAPTRSAASPRGSDLERAGVLGAELHPALQQDDEPRLRPVHAFGLYERIWHWTMAGSGVGLILTGFAIHGGWRWPFGLPAAVAAHNTLAVVLAANAGLALFHHVTTAAIRHFIPEPHGLLARVLEHLEYQTRGIFRGGPRPGQPPGQKLNPLQQLTYLALLNLLFPLQIASGALVWAVGHWPKLAAALGGLSVVAPLHDLGAWLFLSFFTLHAYLVTTGRTLGEHLRSMTTGIQLVEADPDEPKGA